MSSRTDGLERRAMAIHQRPTLVMSGVNMTEGGILSVLRSVVDAAERTLPPEWRIVVLAHRRSLLNTVRAEVREFPAIKASWWRRMNFELRTSRAIASEVSATVWFALHDITPLVDVHRQYVYCHSPSCFMRPTLRALYFDWIFVAHSLFYGLLYSLNIGRNREVYVQQTWIRDAFIHRFGARNVMVSRPSAAHSQPKKASHSQRPLLRWIYPTLARHFKNVEVIGKAVEILERDAGWQGEVAVTISGEEGRYARYVVSRFAHLRSLKFIGRQSPSTMSELYASADGLLFPSKLETWGLPITEAQTHGLPLLVADKPYARETVGTYDGVSFFDPDDASALAALLRELAAGRGTLGAAVGRDFPSLDGWEELVRRVCDLPATT